MKLLRLLCVLCAFVVHTHADDFGKLIFEDTFDRTESQELKDEPGNEWTTASEKTAQGNKQVDLRDGHMYIYTHAAANHATSVRHAFEFRDGTVGLRFKFDDPADSLTLYFADMKLKSVHAGHLFKVVISSGQIQLIDQKIGDMNLKIRNARKTKTITAAQTKLLTTKRKVFRHKTDTGKWHTIHATLKGDQLSCTINGKQIGTFSSEGFAHPTKRLLRLLAPKNVHIDDVKIWCSR